MRGMGRGAASVMLITSVVSSGGCVSASLGTNTGPHPPQQRWSIAAKQMAHVGETVQFDFVLTDFWGRFVAPTGLADYCVTMIGSERAEAESDERGHFRFSYALDHARPGEKVLVTATAYQQRGSRDHMNIRGQWLTADSPYAEPDRKIAGDSIQLTIYQTKVEMKIVRPADDLDPESGVLRLQRGDGAGTPVYIDKPGRPGFRLDGPEPNGYYRVKYQPTGEQLNPSGTTEVEFSVYDLGGQRHVVSQTLSTP